ncbi:MAG: hypothetical protein H6625_04745 [Bdellovibrionaceae bacterium]|nr:hypothetical protein [Pseudobdellovibrionaceae bacterium]
MKFLVGYSMKITLLIVALAFVLFSIFYLKNQGLGENAKQILGISSQQREIKAKVINTPEKILPAASQKIDPKDLNSKDNY